MPDIEVETQFTRPVAMLTYREAAKVLGLPVGTLHALVHQKRIPHVRLGARLVRFVRHDLARWVAERVVPEQPSGGPGGARW